MVSCIPQGSKSRRTPSLFQYGAILLIIRIFPFGVFQYDNLASVRLTSIIVIHEIVTSTSQVDTIVRSYLPVAVVGDTDRVRTSVVTCPLSERSPIMHVIKMQL